MKNFATKNINKTSYDVSDKLVQIRRACLLTRHDLSKLANLSERDIKDWELGTKVINSCQLEILLAVFRKYGYDISLSFFKKNYLLTQTPMLQLKNYKESIDETSSYNYFKIICKRFSWIFKESEGHRTFSKSKSF